MAEDRSRFAPFPGADTSLAAVFALLFGLIPFVPGAGLVAIVLGVFGLRAVAQGRPGKGMAIAGIVLGAFGTVFCCGPIGVFSWLITSSPSSSDTMAIYELDLATKRERLVVDLPGLDTCPVYLADGRAIVFEHGEPGTARLFAPGETDLYVSSSTGSATKLTSLAGAEHSPKLSPRTGDILFIHRAEDGRAVVGRIAPDGSSDAEWFDGTATQEHLLDAEWHPDERALAITRNKSLGSALRLHWFDLDTQTYERVTATEGLGDTSETDPVWTADGFFFAFRSEIILIKPDANELHTVLDRIDVSQMFYRDGRHLIIVNERYDRKAGLYEATLRNDRLDLTPLVLNDDIDGCADVSPDVSRVVYSRLTPPS